MTKNVRHVLGLSGGKDSAALAVHMDKNYPEINVEYFFTDTGYELKETYDYLNKLKTRLNRPIHYINPRNSFDYFLKKYIYIFIYNSQFYIQYFIQENEEKENN